MSMNTSIYVGPFIQATNINGELIEKHESIVADGRGEAGVDESTKYIVPNRKIVGINRETSLDKYSEPIVMKLVD